MFGLFGFFWEVFNISKQIKFPVFTKEKENKSAKGFYWQSYPGKEGDISIK